MHGLIGFPAVPSGATQRFVQISTFAVVLLKTCKPALVCEVSSVPPLNFEAGASEALCQ